MKKRIGFAVLVVAVFAFGAPADDVTDPVSDNVLGILEVSAPGVLQDNLSAFIISVTPEAGATPVLGMLMGQLAKTYNPGLIDETQPFRLLLVKGPEAAVESALIFGTKGVAAYRASLNPQLREVEERDGMTVFSETVVKFDRHAYAKAGPEERKDMGRFIQNVEKPFILADAGNTVIAGRSEQAVSAMREVVRQGGLGAQRLLPGDADIAFHLDMAALTRHIGAREGGLLAALRESAVMAVPAGEEERARRVRAMANTGYDTIEVALKQLAALDASFKVDAQAFVLAASASPLSDSPLARYLDSVPTGVPEILTRIPADATTVVAYRMGDSELLRESYRDVMAATADLIRQTTPDVDVETYLKAAYNTGDQAAFAVRTGDTADVIFITRVKDAALAEKALSALAAWKLSSMNIVEADPEAVRVTPSSVNHNGRAIQEYAVQFKDPGPDEAGFMEMAQSPAAMWRAVLGNQLTIDAAVNDNDQIYTMGGDSLALMKRILDGRPGILADPQFPAFLVTLPEDSLAFGKLDLTQLASFYGRIIAKMAPAFFPKPPTFTRGPGATFIARREMGAVRAELACPAEEIKVIVDGFKSVIAPQGAIERIPPPEGVAPQPEPMEPVQPAQP